MYRSRNQDDNAQQRNFGRPQNYGYSQQQEFYSPDHMMQRNYAGAQPFRNAEADFIQTAGGGQQTFGQGNFNPQSYRNTMADNVRGNFYGSQNQHFGDSYNDQGRNRGIQQAENFRLSTGEYGYGGGSSSGMRNQNPERRNFPLSHNSYGQGGGYSSGMGVRGNYGSADYGYDHGHRYQQERYDDNLGFESRGYSNEGFIERAGNTVREGWNKAENAIRQGWNQVTHWGNNNREENHNNGNYNPGNQAPYDRGFQNGYNSGYRNDYKWIDNQRSKGRNNNW